MTKICIDRSVLEQALEAVDESYADTRQGRALSAALRAALNRPQVEPQGKQEPVATLSVEKAGPKTTIDFLWPDGKLFPDLPEGKHPLYTHPKPQREPLTDEQILKLGWAVTPYANQMEMLSIARAIERAHGIKDQE